MLDGEVISLICVASYKLDLKSRSWCLFLSFCYRSCSSYMIFDLQYVNRLSKSPPRKPASTAMPSVTLWESTYSMAKSSKILFRHPTTAMWVLAVLLLFWLILSPTVMWVLAVLSFFLVYSFSLSLASGRQLLFLSTGKICLSLWFIFSGASCEPYWLSAYRHLWRWFCELFCLHQLWHFYFTILMFEIRYCFVSRSRFWWSFSPNLFL